MAEVIRGRFSARAARAEPKEPPAPDAAATLILANDTNLIEAAALRIFMTHGPDVLRAVLGDVWQRRLGRPPIE